MADHQKVLQEMQLSFPNIPADLVKFYFAKCSYDREACMRQLAQLQLTRQGPPPHGQDINRNNASPGTVRRTSYPVYHNGNHEASRNNPLRSAPASELPFQFTNQQFAVPYRPANHLSPDPRFPLPRIPSPTQGGSQGSPFHLQSSPSGSPVSPRLPSPIRRPQQETPVTYRHPLHLAMPENNYKFEDNIRGPSQVEHHISTLEISPGASPFQSSQFWCYNRPSNPQATGKHNASFNVQIPSPSKPSLTTEIFIETSVAHSPNHYPPVTSSPRFNEPVLMVPRVTTLRPESSKENLPMQSVYQPEHDETAYIEALLEHQRLGLKMISDELEQKKTELQQMKRDLLAQEKQVFERRTKSANYVVTAEETHRLCDEIRKLRVDCHCMSMEVDLLNSNQVPLGVTDENFYRHIFPGQAGNVGSTSIQGPSLPPNKQQPLLEPVQNGSPPESRPQDEVEGKRWKCAQCTFFNHPDLSVCEMCEISRSTPPTCGNGPARL